MIWLSLAAHAAEPVAIRAIVPFTLRDREPAGMVSWRPSFGEGALLAVRVEPATRVPGQGPVPSYWLGDQPLRDWGFDAAQGCAVFLVEGPVDLATAPWFLGPPELPERLRAALEARKGRLAVTDLLRMLHALLELEPMSRKSGQPQLLLETLLVRFALLDRTVDLEEVLKGFGPGGGDGSAEAWVKAGVAPAQAGGDGNFLGQFGKEGPTFDVGGAFRAFDFRPVTVTGHKMNIERGNTGSVEFGPWKVGNGESGGGKARRCVVR